MNFLPKVSIRLSNHIFVTFDCIETGMAYGMLQKFEFGKNIFAKIIVLLAFEIGKMGQL